MPVSSLHHLSAWLSEGNLAPAEVTSWLRCEFTDMVESVDEGRAVTLLYGSVLLTQALCNGGGLASTGTSLYRWGRPFTESLALWAAQQWEEYFRFPSSMGKRIPLFVATSKPSGVLCISQSCVVFGTVVFVTFVRQKKKERELENKHWIELVCPGEQVGHKRTAWLQKSQGMDGIRSSCLTAG